MSTECDRFGRYLNGAPPGPYVREWYERGHAEHPDEFAASTRVDHVLLGLSRLPWLPLRSVDITARFLAPGGAVRRRLVYLTALLENAPETHGAYETPGVGSRIGFFLGLAGRGIASAIALATGLALVGVGLLAGAGRSGP